MMPFWSRIFAHHPKRSPEIDDLETTIVRLRDEQKAATQEALHQENVESSKTVNRVLQSCEEVLKALSRIKAGK